MQDVSSKEAYVPMSRKFLFYESPLYSATLHVLVTLDEAAVRGWNN